jgi:hypothetical protein
VSSPASIRLLPGYVFVRMAVQERLQVLQLSGVQHFPSRTLQRCVMDWNITSAPNRIQCHFDLLAPVFPLPPTAIEWKKMLDTAFFHLPRHSFLRLRAGVNRVPAHQVRFCCGNYETGKFLNRCCAEIAFERNGCAHECSVQLQLRPFT